jgi:hypothetical protein
VRPSTPELGDGLEATGRREFDRRTQCISNRESVDGTALPIPHGDYTISNPRVQQKPYLLNRTSFQKPKTKERCYS